MRSTPSQQLLQVPTFHSAGVCSFTTAAFEWRAWQSRVCVLNDCANVSIAPGRAVYSLTAVTCVDAAAHNRGPDYGLHCTDSELHY